MNIYPDEHAVAFESSDSETNPMCIYLVKNDSKGDKLLFRYPLCSFGEPVEESANDRKWSLHKEAAMDIKEQPHKLVDFTDDVVSNLFAVKMEQCDRKFELKVNNIRFIGHPIQIQTSGTEDEPESPSIILINIVFALDAFARRQIANCYYDLSKLLGIALSHEERRCAYLSTQIKDMILIHDHLDVPISTG